MILTNEKGRPFVKPARASFPEGIEGAIAWMRAGSAYADAVAACANDAFSSEFQRRMMNKSGGRTV
jgi:hypothetical protein